MAGRPLLHWPLDALRAACERVAVAAKPDVALPALPEDVEVWREPPAPRHPLFGIVHALRRAEGAAVIVCAVDLPLVDIATVRALASTASEGAPAVVASHGVVMQPLLARYEPGALPALQAAGTDGRLLDAVAALAPRLVAVPEEVLLNVNDAGDLARAAAALAARGGGVDVDPGRPTRT